ncbi:FAD-dependent oxidoreductase [Aquibium sp. ELW1220]|uniref:FAD-dependent oxidoreductase n=1 Tax=Aquibium sp. ELW1220 TaxID=2976766 RepID=UPI0025B0119D|nr:FAD-dependent oxidoreductase [Aquibium sp. ELW1220]MDN2580948.1 FAD-dependent oxidoreductase [Aquibium sp. ELW1220]
MRNWDYDVAVIGGGPVGLALATEFAARGHSVCVIEQNDRVGVQPRAKTTNVRTMTHMRRWGLAPEMRRRSPLAPGFPRRVRFATGLFGHDIFAFDNAFCASPVRDERFPEHAEFIPQYVVEGILLDHVTAHPLATVRFHTRLESFERMAGGGLAATVRDLETDLVERVTARFLVGADGARSSVRKLLGIQMQGLHSLVSFVTLILRIPGLNADPALQPALFHWLVSPDAPCVMGPMDKEDVWFWGMPLPPGREMSDEDLLATVRKAMRRDFAMEILARDPWTVHKLLADRYRDGDVFLAGDACHLHSPFGGHGMNLGIADAVDLGWKLSAALEGWAGDDLLDSYETERKPAHRLVIETSTENVAALSDKFLAPGLGDDTPQGADARAAAARAVEEAKAPEFRSLGVVLGYRYASPLVVVDEAGDPPAFSVTRYTPTAYPGSLAPHAWLDDGSALYDHFGAGFTLLRLGEPDAAAERELTEAAAERNLPLTLFAPRDAAVRERYGADYALVRPDQHVAWRGSRLAAPAALLDRIRGKPATDPRMAAATAKGRGK